MSRRRIDRYKINHIRSLREKGHSLNEISKYTKVPKTTILRYVAGVEVLPEYKSIWLGKWGGSKKVKLLKERDAYEKGIEFVENLTRKEKILILSSLYWGEGNKKDLSLTNTDPDLIRVFVRVLSKDFNIGFDKLRVSIRIYEDLSKEDCLAFWSKVVGININQFANVSILKGKKSGKLKYGMCRIRVLKGGDLLKKIQGINKAVVNNLAPIA